MKDKKEEEQVSDRCNFLPPAEEKQSGENGNGKKGNGDGVLTCAEQGFCCFPNPTQEKDKQ